MTILVVCTGCQTSYAVPEAMAGKRAKCKKCGASLAIPDANKSAAPTSGPVDLFADLAPSPAKQAAPAASNDLFGDLESAAPQPAQRSAARVPSQQPAGDLFGGFGQSSEPADSSLDDVLSLSSQSAPAALARPAAYGKAPARSQGGAGASIAAAICAPLLCLFGAGIMLLLLGCGQQLMLAMLTGFLGLAAAVSSLVLGLMRKPGLAWGTFGAYCLFCLLGIGLAGFNAYRSISARRQQARNPGSPYVELPMPQPRTNWPPPASTGGSSLPITPTPRRPGIPASRPTERPWEAPDTARDIVEPRTENWQVTVDTPPEWAQVGEGREFQMQLDRPGWDPLRLGKGYARSIAFQHQLGGIDVLEVWDLGERKQVGALRGRNNFQSEIALSPTGKYVAGAVRPERGWHGPLQVWSVAQAEMVLEIPPPAGDRDVDILDFADDETLLSVYRSGNDNYVLKMWTIASGAEKQHINLGPRQTDKRNYALSPGRKYFAKYDNQRIEFWNLETGDQAGAISLPSDLRCEAFAFSPDGSELAAVCSSSIKSALVLWQAHTGQFKKQLKINASAHELLSQREKGGNLPIGWLGTGEAYLLGGKRVVSAKDGTVIWSLPTASSDQPSKLLDADQLITFERGGSGATIAMRPFPFGQMDGETNAVAAGGTAIDAKLPPLGKLDMSGVKEVAWQPGGVWNVTPDPRPALKTNAASKPISLTGERLAGIQLTDPSVAAAIILDVDRASPENTELGVAVASYLTRLDLVSGKETARLKVPGGSHLLAISPSGQRAVLTIGFERGRIDMYSLGETPGHVAGWRPYLDESPDLMHGFGERQMSRQSVNWGAFIDEDHLLTSNALDGQLVLWKVPEMKALYRLPTASSSKPALSPTGKYVVVQPQDRVAILDARTGAACGDFTIPFTPAGTTTAAPAFSNDGTRLATLVQDVGGAFLLTYDLKQGKEIARMPMAQGSMQWVGTRQLLVGGDRNYVNRLQLVDLDRRATVWRYDVISGYKVASVPDNRIWMVAASYQTEAVLVAQPFQMTAEINTAMATLPLNPAPIFGPGSTVELDTSGVGSAGSPDLAERARQQWSTHLISRGVKIGSGGLKLSASTSSGESRSEEYTPSRFGFPSRSSGDSGNFSFSTTDINLQVQLTDSAGKKHWESKSVARYYMPSSIWGQEKSPQQVLSEGQAAAHRSGTDSFYLGVRLPYMIYPQPVDKDGIPGLGSSLINLSTFVRQNSNKPRRSNSADDLKEAVRTLYTQVLNDNPSLNKDHWQWCPGLNRPIAALRWGLGVQVKKSDDELLPTHPTAAVLRDLTSVSGPIGPAIVQMLRAKQAEGKFGSFAGLSDDKLRDVVILGAGERSQLAASARKAGVDLVLIIKLEPIVKGRQRDAQLSLEVLDLASSKKLWSSETLLESRVNAAKRTGQDLLTELCDKIAEDIDAKLALQPIETMPSGTHVSRLEAGATHRANPLAALAEIDFYLCREMISEPSAQAAFLKVLGNSADATALAGENLKAREAAITKAAAALTQKLE